MLSGGRVLACFLPPSLPSCGPCRMESRSIARALDVSRVACGTARAWEASCAHGGAGGEVTRAPGHLAQEGLTWSRARNRAARACAGIQRRPAGQTSWAWAEQACAETMGGSREARVGGYGPAREQKEEEELEEVRRADSDVDTDVRHRCRLGDGANTDVQSRLQRVSSEFGMPSERAT